MIGAFRQTTAGALALLLIVAAVPSDAMPQAPSWRPGMPEEVVSLRQRWLAREDYENLAGQWRQYLAENPQSAVAAVQLGRALHYAGHAADVVNDHYARALQIDPDCPEAMLAAASSFLGPGKSLAADAAAAYELGMRAAAAAPFWAEPHYALWPLALRLGDEQAAAEQVTALLHKGGICGPVLDYCYNMLVGADRDAVIFTNGDNDTYGCEALQAARGLRRDVHVVNLSLLNLAEAEEIYFARFAPAAPPLSAAEREALREEFRRDYVRDRELYSTKVMKNVAERAADGRWPHPVYLALTISANALEACTTARRIEGLLWRVVPGLAESSGDGDQGVDLARSGELFAGVYRLDSATDLAFAWERNDSVGRLMTNYAAVYGLIATAAAEAGDTAAMREAFAAALQLADFHQQRETLAGLAGTWLELDPDNQEAQRWSSRAK